MCTVSILRTGGGAGGYALWFNRDERLGRAAELAPRPGVAANGVRYVAPRDGERGGAWLMVNERGLTACVLNDYEANGAAPGEVSRGGLPLACAGCGDAAEAVAAVHEWTDAAGGARRLGAFLLVVVDAGGGGRCVRWDGRVWREADAPEFASSSSFRPAEVRARREARHAEISAGGRTAERLAALHWEHDAGAGAESVRMRRPDACTRSVCAARVRTTEAGVAAELVYTAIDWSPGTGAGARAEVRL